MDKRPRRSRKAASADFRARETRDSLRKNLIPEVERAALHDLVDKLADEAEALRGSWPRSISPSQAGIDIDRADGPARGHAAVRAINVVLQAFAPILETHALRHGTLEIESEPDLLWVWTNVFRELSVLRETLPPQLREQFYIALQRRFKPPVRKQKQAPYEIEQLRRFAVRHVFALRATGIDMKEALATAAIAYGERKPASVEHWTRKYVDSRDGLQGQAADLGARALFEGALKKAGKRYKQLKADRRKRPAAK